MLMRKFVHTEIKLQSTVSSIKYIATQMHNF